MPIRVATVRAADVPASQTDMPLYIDIGRVGATPLTLAEANSSRWFTDTDLVTQMAREIVSLTEGHGKYPTLTSTSKIAIDYDGVRADYAVTDTFGRNNVWSDYAAVYHLSNVNNSQATSLDLTNNNSATFSSGKIGDTGNFVNTSSQWLSRSYNSNLNIGGGDFTITGWARRTTDAYFQIMGMGWNEALASHLYVLLMYHNDDNFHFNWIDGTGREVRDTAVTIANNVWNKFSVRRTGTTIEVKINDAAKVTGTGTLQTTTAGTFVIGQGGGGFNFLNGSMDEVRIRKSYVSDNWMNSEYYNQNAESTFWGAWATFVGPVRNSNLTMMGVG